MDRRLFIQSLISSGSLFLWDGSGASFLSLPAEAMTHSSTQFFAFGDGPDVYTGYKYDKTAVPNRPSWVWIWDFRGNLFKIDVPMFPHVVVQNPLRPNIAIVTSRYANICSLIDLSKRKIIKTISSSPDYLFFGHAVFSSDGRFLITSENQNKLNYGALVFRDLDKDLKVVREIPTGGRFPHDCHFLDDGKTIVVANQHGLYMKDLYIKAPGSTEWIPERVGCVSYIDSLSGKIIRQIECGTLELAPVHFSIGDNGILVCIGKSKRYTGLSASFVRVVLPDGHYEDLPVPSSQKHLFIGESLSSAIYQDTVAVTLPKSKTLWFWNYKKKEFLKVMTFKNKVKGVTLTDDKKHFLLAGTMKETLMVDSKTLEIDSKVKSFPVSGIGSHLGVLSANFLTL
jgi:hypothetical protein